MRTDTHCRPKVQGKASMVRLARFSDPWCLEWKVQGPLRVSKTRGGKGAHSGKPTHLPSVPAL